MEYRLPWLDCYLTEIGFGRTVRAVYDSSDPSKTLALSGVIISAIGLLAMVDALRNKQPKPYWLGTGTIASRSRKYRTFNEARKFVRSLKLKNGEEWKAYKRSGKVPIDIPAAPQHAYLKKGWKGMRDWLGTNADE
ncbi:hypothetical protein N8527_01505 [bacterium]|nr:hypothetical protein [bacterium]